MMAATMSMEILRGAPEWRDEDHGREMLQLGERLQT
jgi:hypothetical protein